jgi:hypothetical protein
MTLSATQLTTKMLPHGSSEGSFVPCNKPHTQERYNKIWVSGRSEK